MTAAAPGRDAEPRFAFGRNWQRFATLLDERRIDAAVTSLASYLDVDDLRGRSFVDVGSGSGLFSLAAHRLGARVHSFDYDPDSVACTASLRDRFADGADDWVVEQGSLLDRDYLEGLGTFDVVYSWGVLHHTGDLRTALENVVPLVAPGGRLYVAIYNDPGPSTEVWRRVKRRYASGGPVTRAALVGASGAVLAGAALARRALPSYRTTLPPDLVSSASAAPDGTLPRGMSRWYDLVDWVGGYPYEAARPEAVFDLYRGHGFRLDRLVTCAGRHGCSELVLTRAP